MEDLIDQLFFLIFGQSVPVESALFGPSFDSWAVSFHGPLQVSRRWQKPLDGLAACLRRKLVKRLQKLVFEYGYCRHRCFHQT